MKGNQIVKTQKVFLKQSFRTWLVRVFEHRFEPSSISSLMYGALTPFISSLNPAAIESRE